MPYNATFKNITLTKVINNGVSRYDFLLNIYGNYMLLSLHFQLFISIA